MFGRTLTMAFWVLYDHAGKLMLANLIAVSVMLVPLSVGLAALASGNAMARVLVGIPAAGLLLACAIPAVLAGLAHMVKELIETHDGSVHTMLAGMRLYWRRATVLGVGFWLMALGLGASIAFYPYFFKDWAPWLGYALSGLAVWALVFVVCAAMFALPALVQKKTGVWPTAKLAALLVIDKPLFALGLAVQLASVSVILLVPPIAALLYFAVVVVILSTAYEQLARMYALRAYAQTGVLNTDALGRLQLVTRDGRVQVDDAHDDYLNRGLRDALFPWKE
jgi:uncharacterized membrane protein YesL